MMMRKRTLWLLQNKYTEPFVEQELRNISTHMKKFAVASFGHALWHVIMTGRGGTPWTEPFGLIHAVHGGELLIKAAIAKVHPLLIFSKTPSLDKEHGRLLSFEMLIKSGRTLQYNELPDNLWAATGFVLPDLDTYRKMGELRNSVQHFAVPDDDYRCHVLRYLCNVADPLLRKFWSTEIFREIVDGWEEQDYYLFDDEPWVLDALKACDIEYNGWIPTPKNP